MSDGVRCISPGDGSVVAERPYAGSAQIDEALSLARAAQAEWARRSVAERAALCSALVDRFVGKRDAIAEEITRQMGRPLSQSPGEIRGFEERARKMIELAEPSLAPVVPEERAGERRFIRREPHGVVLTIAPWNYPYLTAVNSVVPALLAGNAVLLRHSAQTPLCSERFAEAADAADLPRGLLQALHCDHAATEGLIADDRVDFVAFTGSVPAGQRVQRAAADRFIGVGLELGGKDPAYVRADAPFERSVDGVIDGAFFNSGQSCCGIERVYVADSLFDRFVEAAVEQVRAYRLGDPLRTDVNLGPLVNSGAAQHVRDQIADATGRGARALVDPAEFDADREDTPYLAPQLLMHVDHSMRVMVEESFGPVLGIMRVADDDEAVHWMNDSEFGLTASVWTEDEEAALAIGERVQTGTFFMNRCDYLDPELAWTGVKNSGRGCTLSRIGFEALTRPKSFSLRG